MYSDQAKVLTARLRQLRKEAGMSQREFAEKLGRDQTMVGRIEVGERRVDFIECYWLFKALGVDPVKETKALMEQIADLDDEE